MCIYNLLKFSAKIINESHSLQSGTIVLKNNTIQIAVRDGFISPIEIQIEGKKRMNIHDFTNGFSFANVIIAD